MFVKQIWKGIGTLKLDVNGVGHNGKVRTRNNQTSLVVEG